MKAALWAGNNHLYRRTKGVAVAVVFLLSCCATKYVFAQVTDTADLQADLLLQQLTLGEKAQLLGYSNTGVPRLNIPAYNWWSEGLHGVARAGDATIYPQAIALAATFNDSLVYTVASCIATEARAKYNLTNKRVHGMYTGLTYWSPNINIFRDPRWGRGQETYGEDPYLTARIGVAYVTGMQGPVKGRYKIAAAAKHFVAHSGPESTRDNFNAVASQADLHNTYLYAFHKLADCGVAGIMTAYNRVNGVPNSVNDALLKNMIRKEWGFKGYIVTDCGALDDVFETHKYLQSPVDAAAAAIKAGINLDCSSILQNDVEKAIEQKLIKEEDVNAALRPLLQTEARLGFFDDPALSPYYSYRDDSIHNAYHMSLALAAAQQSMVLLKNDNDILPLKQTTLSSIMVVGPNSAAIDALVGNYHGVSSKLVNFVEGITASVGKGTRVEYDLGCSNSDTTHFGGIWAAGNADITIAVIGLLPVSEGEAGDAFLSPAGGDRLSLDLPASHVAFMKALRKSVKKPIIAVVTAGSAVNIAAIAPYADAIILAWYPGEQGGTALADILFGKISPSGRLPVTFYNSIHDLPPFDDYAMAGRTYRYFKGNVQYPFGYGLSYTTFDYNISISAGLKPSYRQKDTITLQCYIKNTGHICADEVAQLYICYPPGEALPVKELKAFQRVTLGENETQQLTFRVPISELKKWDAAAGKDKLYPGSYIVQIGSNSDDKKIVLPFTIAK